MGVSDVTDYQENEPASLLQELRRATLSGGGMFVESYFIFAVGNLTGIWAELYPYCKTNNACNQALTAIPFVQVAGIIIAQLTFGFIADIWGRLWGARLTATLMAVGGTLATIAFGSGGAVSGATPATVDSITGMFIMFNVAIFIFSLGVGGEYPIASTAASERSENEKIPRGRTVTFVFAHQGWGNVANTIVLCFMLAVTGTGNCTPSAVKQNATVALNDGGVCSSAGLEATWRVGYGLGCLCLYALFAYRWFFMKESVMWRARQDEKYFSMGGEEHRKKRRENFGRLFSPQYRGALFGAAMSWFVWDVAFYGNKLFQSTIITSIVGKDSSLLEVLEYTLLNSAVALAGYYVAAFTIDKPWMGRVRMQTMGFLVSFVLFFVCGFAYNVLVGNLIGLFLFFYLASSFWGQWCVVGIRVARACRRGETDV